MPNQASDKVSKASSVGALGVGDQEWELGTENRRAFSLPSLLSPEQLSLAASLRRGAALCHTFTVDLAECHGGLGPAQPCVTVFTGRLLCPGSWIPEGQEVAGEAMQGLSRHLGVMGSPSERRLAGDRARWGWGSSVFPPSHLAPILLDLPCSLSPLGLCVALPST